MSDNFDIVPVPAEAAPVAPPIKWLRYLLYVHVASLLVSLTAPLSLEIPIFSWISRFLTAGTAVCLFQLAPACQRYRKAAMLTVIALVLTLAALLLMPNLLTMAASILAIIASYQELHGHGELVEPKDPKLSKKWCNLFIWELVIGLISGLSSVAAVVIMVFVNMDPDRIIAIILGAMALVSLIPGILYLVYLRRTIALFEE